MSPRRCAITTSRGVLRNQKLKRNLEPMGSIMERVIPGRQKYSTCLHPQGPHAHTPSPQHGHARLHLVARYPSRQWSSCLLNASTHSFPRLAFKRLSAHHARGQTIAAATTLAILPIQDLYQLPRATSPFPMVIAI